MNNALEAIYTLAVMLLVVFALALGVTGLIHAVLG